MLTLHNLGALNKITVNPITAKVNYVIAPQTKLYKLGDTLFFIVVYNEKITVTDTISLPSLKITIGNSTKQVFFQKILDTQTLLFNYIIQAGDFTTDGIKIHGTISLNNAQLKDQQGFPVSLLLNNIGNTSGILLDAIPPIIKNVAFLAKNLNKEKDTLNFVFHFTEKIMVSASTIASTISLTIGTKERSAAYITGHLSDSLLYRYIIQNGDSDNDGIKVGALLNNIEVKDIAGNIGSISFNPPTTKNYIIDAIQPYVLSVTTPNKAVYKTGNSLDFFVHFSEKIFVKITDKIPSLLLATGSKVKQVVYVSGSGTSVLAFRYIIDSLDMYSDSLQLISPIQDTNVSIKDSAGNQSLLSLNNMGALKGIHINPPTISIIKVTVPSLGFYKMADTLFYQLQFNGKVLVSTILGIPSFTFSIGNVFRQARYLRGSDTNLLLFAYIIQSGDEGNAIINPNTSLNLNNGSIKDILSISTNQVLANIGSTKDIFIDAVSPFVKNVQLPVDKTYHIGETLSTVLNFNESVFFTTKTDTPFIKFVMGSTTKNMIYKEGSGTQNIIFQYTIQSGDLDKKGIVIGSIVLSLNNTIKDIAGNGAQLNFKSSLPVSNIKIDGIAPIFVKDVSDTIKLCENSSQLTISNALTVLDQEIGESIFWNIISNPKLGSLSRNSITTIASGKNQMPIGFEYYPFKNTSGIDTLISEISDGINVSQKKLILLIQSSIQNNVLSSTQVICIDQTPERIMGSLPSGGDGIMKYVWEVSITNDSVGYSPAAGLNNFQTYLPSSLKNNTWYRRQTISGSCENLSDPVKIIVLKNGIWTGKSNNDWHNANNWCLNYLPAKSTDVLIFPGSLYTPMIKDSAWCHHLTILANTELIINGILQVNGNMNGPKGSIQAEKGTIVMNSSDPQNMDGQQYRNQSLQNLIINNHSGLSLLDSLNITRSLLITDGFFDTHGYLTMNTGSEIGPSASGSEVKGTISVKHFLKGGRRSYRLIGHPFSQEMGLQMLKDSIDITGEKGFANGFTTTPTNQPSAFIYDSFLGNDSTGMEEGWVPFTYTNGLANNLWRKYKGIRFLFRGKLGQGLDGTPPGDGKNGTYLPNPVTLKLTGNINMGDQEVILEKNNYANYHVISNPYLSNINLSNISRGKEISQNYWLWNWQQGWQGGYTSFPFRSKNILPPLGAFIVKVNDHSDNIILFTENCKSIDTIVEKIPTLELEDLFHIELRLESDSIFWDRILLVQMDSAKTGVDKNDAEKFWNADVNFYSLSRENKMLSIDARPFNNESIIPIGFQTDEIGNFTIRVAKCLLLSSNNLMLHDKYLQKWMKLENDSTYSFSTTVDTASSGNKRFEIISQKKAADAILNKPKVVIQISPIPASDKILVKYTFPEKGATSIRIVNLSGKLVKSFMLGQQKEGQEMISIADLINGIYILELKCGKLLNTQKIIKE